MMRWSKYRQDKFHETQWKFVVPVFRYQPTEQRLSARDIFPFIDIGTQSLSYLSDVMEVVIRKDHLELARSAQYSVPRYITQGP